MPIITRRIFHLRSKPQLGGAGSQPLNVSDVTVYSYRPSLLLGFLFPLRASARISLPRQRNYTVPGLKPQFKRTRSQTNRNTKTPSGGASTQGYASTQGSNDKTEEHRPALSC
jgi:hypothetical protein